MKSFDPTSAIKSVISRLYRWVLSPYYGRPTSNNDVSGLAKSVLIIRGDAIGDFVLFMPALKELCRAYPDSRISLVVCQEVAGLANTNTPVHDVIPFDRRRYRRSIVYRLALIRHLRRLQFSVAINPIYSREPSTDEILCCCGAQERIAFWGDANNITVSLKEANNAYYTRIIPSRSGVIAELGRNQEFVEKLTGRKPCDEESQPRISLSDVQLQDARRLLMSEGVDPEVDRLVVLFPGASNAIKMWPAERFAILANRITETFKARILIAGTSSDFETQEAVSLKTSVPVVRLVGRTDLLQLAAILKYSAIYVGNDTGPLHLAIAVGTPTICILGGGHFGRSIHMETDKFTMQLFTN